MKAIKRGIPTKTNRNTHAHYCITKANTCNGSSELLIYEAEALNKHPSKQIATGVAPNTLALPCSMRPCRRLRHRTQHPDATFLWGNAEIGCAGTSTIPVASFRPLNRYLHAASGTRASPALSFEFLSHLNPAAIMNARSILRIRSACPQRSLRCFATRQFLVGGNWKCNGTVASVKTLVSDLNAGSVPSDIEIVCAPVFVHLPYVLDNLNKNFAVSAQNCWTEPGAFTGEVSADMLVDMGIPWVITGHSERRALIGETSQHVGEKSAYAIGKGLKVIACVGESLPQRESGELWDVLSEQMSGLKDSLSIADWGKVVIAYEPVWAIGTGVVATPEQAQVRNPQPCPHRYDALNVLFLNIRCSSGGVSAG